MSALSFRARLTLLSAAGIAVVLAIGSVATYVIMRSQLRGQVDTVLRAQAAKMRELGSPFGGQVIQQRTAPTTRLKGEPGVALGDLQTSVPRFGSAPVFALVVNGNLKVPALAAGSEPLPVSERVLELARTGQGGYFTDAHVRGTHLRIYVSALGNGYAVVLARSLSEVDGTLTLLAWGLGITCLAGIVLAAIVGAAVARGALRPVRRLTETAERITHTHDLGERIEADGEDELSRLGASFNAMLDSLEGAIRSQRRLVADASHELRTPLTSLRTNTDLLRQGIALSDRDRERLLRDVGSEIEELTAMVANLVDLARGSQRDLHLRPVRLDQLVEGVVRRARARFPALTFTVAAESTTVTGDSEELERAVWNLVENAAKWSDGDGRVQLTVADGEVTVSDHGPGVPAADQPFIFDRFYRSETSRGHPGSGLGLAIVRQIAENHGGRIEVEEAVGGGACFRFSLVEANRLQTAAA